MTESHDESDLTARAAEAERQAAQAATTHVLTPRQRVFLPQTFGNRVRGFWWYMIRVTLFRCSPINAVRWRNMLLRLFGARVARSAAVAPSALIEYPWNLTLGEGVVVCDHVIINCMGTVNIADKSRISQYAHICAGTHEYQRPDMRIQPLPITLGRDVWIAADAFVGPGVHIHDGALLAARSSAFHDLPMGMICVGEPARPVKVRG